ncbi:hypothetical protein U1Q18_050079 [Sarracenia purpurea var. burkii]
MLRHWTSASALAESSASARRKPSATSSAGVSMDLQELTRLRPYRPTVATGWGPRRSVGGHLAGGSIAEIGRLSRVNSVSCGASSDRKSGAGRTVTSAGSVHPGPPPVAPATLLQRQEMTTKSIALLNTLPRPVPPWPLCRLAGIRAEGRVGGRHAREGSVPKFLPPRQRQDAWRRE